MKHPDPNKIGSAYWICDFCARERGGVYFKSCSTASTRDCGYCDGAYQVEQHIFPSLDYIWPSQAARAPEKYRKWAERLASDWADSKVSEEARKADPTGMASQHWQHIYDEELKRIVKAWRIE